MFSVSGAYPEKVVLKGQYWCCYCLVTSPGELQPVKHAWGFLSYDHEVPHILKPPPCFTPLFPGSTNELAHLESCLCPAFTCLYDGEKTNSRCGKPLDSYLRKCKVMLILDLCQKSRVIQESDTITLLLSSTPLTCLLLSLALQVVVQK